MYTAVFVTRQSAVLGGSIATPGISSDLAGPAPSPTGAEPVPHVTATSGALARTSTQDPVSASRPLCSAASTQHHPDSKSAPVFARRVTIRRVRRWASHVERMAASSSFLLSLLFIPSDFPSRSVILVGHFGHTHNTSRLFDRNPIFRSKKTVTRFLL
jgi:hypothetical protein